MPEEKFPKSPQDIDLESAGQKLLASLPNLNKVSKERRNSVRVQKLSPGCLFLFIYPTEPCDFLLSFSSSLYCIRVENTIIRLNATWFA